MSALISENTTTEIVVRAKAILKLEQKALELTSKNLGEDFSKAIDILMKTKGRIIITGVGKSGLIGKKIASTLRSTGTKAYFIHSTEAAHGDLGSIDETDAVIALSNSGTTKEIITLIPLIKKIGAKLIAITGDGDKQSPLSKNADSVITIVIDKEACAFNLAPTASTTAMLGIGDCIAIILSELKKFKMDDFAFYHPSGTLGRKLLFSVRDIMHNFETYPVAFACTPLSEIVASLTERPYGGINIVDSEQERNLIGIITDGDIRRALLRQKDFFSLCAEDVMTKNPVTITPDIPAAEALALMENRKRQISVLSVVDHQGKALGILRLHDILQP